MLDPYQYMKKDERKSMEPTASFIDINLFSGLLSREITVLSIFLFRYSMYTKRKGMARMWVASSLCRASLNMAMRSCQYMARVADIIAVIFMLNAMRLFKWGFVLAHPLLSDKNCIFRCF